MRPTKLLSALALLACLAVPFGVHAADAPASRSGTSYIVKSKSQLFTATPGNGDDLVIDTKVDTGGMYLPILVTPGAATTTLNSISDGKAKGQVLELFVSGSNALVVPTSLTNVDFGNAGDQTIYEASSLVLKWDGTDWRISGALPGLTATAAELNILDGVTATAAELNLAADISAIVETVTTTNVITSAECGKTFFLNAAAGFASTLPAPTAGCRLRFVVKAAPTSGAYTIATNGDANVLIGGVNELEVDTNDDGPYSAVGDLVTFVQNVAVAGDFVEVISDGTSFYLHGQTNADGGVTIGST